MYMKDWIKKLDDFLKLSDDNILTNAGKISHELAVKHATEEYKKYKAKPIDEYTQVEKDFIEQVNKTYKMLKKKERPKK